MNGMAGELGHYNIEPEGHPCGCGSRGCLEQYASATAIVRMAHEAIDSGNAPDLDDLAHGNVEFTSRSVYQLAIQDHPSAQKIYQRVGRALGIGYWGHGERPEPAHVRHRRRRVQCVGCLRARDV